MNYTLLIIVVSLTGIALCWLCGWVIGYLHGVKDAVEGKV